jgi:hypothetical protein
MILFWHDFFIQGEIFNEIFFNDDLIPKISFDDCLNCKIPLSNNIFEIELS